MTTRIKDIAPNEALLLLLEDRIDHGELSGAALTEREIRELLKLHPESLEILRRVLQQFRAAED